MFPFFCARRVRSLDAGKGRIVGLPQTDLFPRASRLNGESIAQDTGLQRWRGSGPHRPGRRPPNPPVARHQRAPALAVEHDRLGQPGGRDVARGDPSMM